MKEKKVLFSTLWLFAILNYLYCDLLTLMDSNLLKQILTGTVGNIHMTESFLLGASVLMEIPISMVLVSRLVRYGINRWLNVAAGAIMTLVQIATLIGTSTVYYKFFSAIEISTTIAIVILALKWVNTESETIREVNER